ncbi:MAG: radical SAM family heme chaperone HemW, partial [Actinomycetota bacterium]
AGAHSYRDGHRWWNLRPPGEYLDAVEHGHRPVGGEERLTPQDERLEEVFLKLRILEGVPAESVAADPATMFLEQGLLASRDGHLVPTERGLLLLNELVLGLVS